jgi:hypothetical protein
MGNVSWTCSCGTTVVAPTQAHLGMRVAAHLSKCTAK